MISGVIDRQATSKSVGIEMGSILGRFAITEIERGDAADGDEIVMKVSEAHVVATKPLVFKRGSHRPVELAIPPRLNVMLTHRTRDVANTRGGRATLRHQRNGR